MFVLKDIRCKKAVFRKNYPDLCPGVVEDDTIEDEEEDPDWLEDRCKHKNFRSKNADICRDLCPQKKWSKLYRDICDGLPAPVQPQITDEQKQQDLTRWGALAAYQLITANKEAYERLVKAFREKKSVAECVSIIEGV